MVTEILEKKEFSFATVVKINSPNICIQRFPFSRCKEKQVFLLAAWREGSIFGSQENPVPCKTLFLLWNLKSCKLYGVSSTEEQFVFPRKLIPAADNFLIRRTGCSF